MGACRSVLPEDPNWPYFDSPWSLLQDCQLYNAGEANSSSYLGACVLSHMLGFVSAYIFPFVGLFGVISNILVTYVFLFVFRKPSRQMIYLACVATSDLLTIILFGWIWMFPSKGLPYASGARIYFFVFNISDISCKITRYLYSLTSCLSSSLFLLTALDRCLCIYFPLKFARISTRRAWEAVGVTFTISALIMLPFGVLVEHGPSNGKIICWVQTEANTLQIYHVLLANSSLVQTILVIIINIALLIRLRQSALVRETMSKCTSANKEIAASMLLVILSTAVVICALPQSIAYILSTILQQVLNGDSGRMAVRMAYNISDLGWQLLFLQQSTNFLFYLKRMKNFRRAIARLLRCKLGRGLMYDAFESIHYLSTKARNLTSEFRFTRGGGGDMPKNSGNRSSKPKKKKSFSFWRTKHSSNVAPADGTHTQVEDQSTIGRGATMNFGFKGGMRHTQTMSTISPGTIFAEADCASPKAPAEDEPPENELRD